MDRSSLVLLLCCAVVPAGARAESPPPVVAIPFGCGLTFPVSQVHAVGTHVDNDVWAWDFQMPEGTPVVAALDGVVRLARGDSTEGGCDRAMARTANYVVLEHAGGLESQYLHFSRVVVAVGQTVRQGQLLGYSGATGWACGPHLHFKVARPEYDGWNNPSIAARIGGYGDPALGTRVSSPACPSPEVMVAGGAPAAAPSAPGGASVGASRRPAAFAPGASIPPLRPGPVASDGEVRGTLASFPGTPPTPRGEGDASAASALPIRGRVGVAQAPAVRSAPSSPSAGSGGALLPAALAASPSASPASGASGLR